MNLKARTGFYMDRRFKIRSLLAMNSRGNTSKLYAEPGTKKKRKTYKNISGFHLSDEKFAVTKDLL